MTAPLRADAERNRRRLLDAAAELFAERGVEVTLDDVARHAGVGTGTAYRRFPNKDALIGELMVEKLTALEAAACAALEEPDPWAGLRSYFESALDMQVRNRALAEILWSSNRGAEQVAMAREKLAPVVGRLVQRAVDAGVVRPEVSTSDVPVISLMLSTVVAFGRPVEPELYRRYLAIVLDGLRPGHDPLPVDALPLPRFAEAMAAYRR